MDLLNMKKEKGVLCIILFYYKYFRKVYNRNKNTKIDSKLDTKE